jgi:hypothetical protein
MIMQSPIAKRREGFAILVVLVGVLVLSTMTLTALNMGSQETRSALATRVSASSLYAAETGVSIVRVGTWPNLPPAGKWDPGEVTLPSAGKYRPVIERRDNGMPCGTDLKSACSRLQIYSLTVTGWSFGPLGGEATVQIWATRFQNSYFNAGVAAKGNIDMQGATKPSLIDSYDSRLGPYCTPEMLAKAQCATENVGTFGNVLANGNVKMGGDARIDGNVTVGGTIDYDNTRVTINGDETSGAPKQDYPVENCPDLTPVSGAGITYKNGDVTLSGAAVTFTSGTYSFDKFTVTGKATLVIPAGNFVRIYISGAMTIDGFSSVNNEGKNPQALSLVACNRGGTTNKNKWNVAGYSDAYYTIYAPNNDLVFGGEGAIFGAVIGNNVSLGGGAAVHFDIALADNGGSFSAVTPRSWRQILRN